MKTKVLFLANLFLMLFVSCAAASWDKKPEFRWMEYFRYETRHNRDWLYANRISATFNYLDAKQNSLFKLTPFYEARRNFNTDLWERQELGVEIGKEIFSWLYVGESIREVWLKEAYRQYPTNKERDATESETRLMFSYNLLDKKNIKLKGFILDEYTYDFKRGAGTRNEIVIGLIMPLAKIIETGINWTHIDRIHDYDSDAVEVLVTMVF